MESLLQQTNHMLFQLNHQMESLVQSQDEIIFEAEDQIRKSIEDIYSRLSDYVFKEPFQRRASSKVMVDQIVYDVRHVETSYKSYLHKKKAKLG